MCMAGARRFSPFTSFIIRRYGADMPSKAGVTEARAAALVGAGIRDKYLVAAACSFFVTV